MSARQIGLPSDAFQHRECCGALRANSHAAGCTTNNARVAFENTDIGAFLIRLGKIDKRGLTARDAILIYYFMAHPGNSGADACYSLGIEHRSSIQLCLKRLFAAGLLEDRRTEFSKRVTGRLYVTPAGVAFWEEIKP